MSEKPQKLVLDYPCSWSYTVIGSDQARLARAIATVVQERPCRISPAKSSRTGKYQSMHLELVVGDEAERTELYLALKAQEDIVLVM